MKPLDLKDFEQGLEDYWNEIKRRSDIIQRRERAYETLATRFRARKPPHFTRSEVTLIIRWKHTDGRWCSRSLSGLQRVSDGRLMNLTSQIDDLDASELMALFCGAITGVGVATISAIITAARPDRFAVIDDFALRAIFFHYRPEWVRRVYRDKKGRFQPTERDYRPFVEFCRERAAEMSRLAKRRLWTPRMVEMALWAIGKSLVWRTLPVEE
jgi:hypothetical protein